MTIRLKPAVVGADTLPEVAVGFIEALAQDPGSGLHVGAEIVAQRQEGRAGRATWLIASMDASITVVKLPAPKDLVGYTSA